MFWKVKVRTHKRCFCRVVWFVHTEVHISDWTWKCLRVVRDAILLKTHASSSFQWGVCFTYSFTHRGIGRECNVNVCVLGSDLMWFQHILIYNSWPSHCPSFDQSLLPRWKTWTWCFWKTFGRGDWGLVAWWEFFWMLWLVVMVVWWGRRNWWDGSAQSQTVGVWQTYTPPTPRFTKVEA